MPDHVHDHDPTAEPAALLQALAMINTTLRQGFMHMSEAADALTQAVNDASTKIDTLTTSLQVEIQQITAALSSAGGDAALQAAAADAITRLGAISAKVEELNSTVQGIIP